MKVHNHRYLMYCRTYGKTPEQMLAYDRILWPGKAMCGFALWISKCFSTFCNEFNRDRNNLDLKDHADFDNWLRVFPQPPL